MENAEEIMHSLEEFSKLKPKDIPRELEDYLGYVAKTGDPVFKWSVIKCLFREKLLNVITAFYESTLSIELPPCPNVDPFNYERMKANLLEKLDSFSGVPFTVQRISELLTNPWKEYNRADKFMRAIEKNILVVSTREPGRNAENDPESQQDTSFNGISGPNDSGIESSFSCNDLADADSSSQQCDLSQESKSSLIVGVDSDSISSVTFKDNEASIGDSASPNDIGIIRNDEVSQEIIIEEKYTETVICSTVATETTEEILEEHISDKEAKTSDLTSVSEIVVSEDELVHSNTPDTEPVGTKEIHPKVIIEEPKEVTLIGEVTVTVAETIVEGVEVTVEEETKPSIVEVHSSTDCDTNQVLVEKVEESSEDCKEQEAVSSCESSEIEVGECQVSDVGQSQS